MASQNPSRARSHPSKLVWLVALALLVGACSDGGSDSSSTSFDAAPAAAPPATTAAASLADTTGDGRETSPAIGEDATQANAPSDNATSQGLAVPTALTATDLGRDIVFTATIDVEVDDVAAAGAEARNAVRALGGVVFSESTSTSGSPRTVLTFKVNPADFDRALDSLAKIGDLVNQRVSADDVTERIVDLQSRVTTAEASVIRLRKLLDQAGDISALASLENQLLNRETLLEQLRGQLRTVQDQVALSTITLTITQAASVIQPAAVDLVAGLGSSAADACPGSLDLSVDRIDTATLCVEIDNIGESPLTNIRLESGSLRLRLSDFDIVDGDADAIEPGGQLIATTELSVQDGRVKRRSALGGLNIDLRVTAESVDGGNGTVTASSNLMIVASNDKPLPGFGDSLSAGASALALVASLGLIGFAGVLPFLPLLLIVGWLMWRRRHRATAADFSETAADYDEK